MDPSIHEVPESSESQEDDVVVLQEFPTHHTERSASRGSYKDTKSNHSNECHPKDDGDDENDIMFIENVKSHSKSNPSSVENVESSSEQNGNLSVTKDQEDDTEEGELSVNDGELGAGVCDFIVIDEVGADVDVDENGECSNEDEPSVVFSEDPTGLFCLDTNPEVSKEKPLGPRFRREFNATLSSESDAKDSESTEKNVYDNRCFNCQGDHTLSACPNPRDQRAIGRNRAAFLKSQPNKVNMNRRYHFDDPSNFEQFKPGVISDELRKALGLRRSEIPLHIYKMRVLGYPPGWIEDVKQQSSGLDFIDNPNSSSSSEEDTVSYDVERIISYPGFNVPLKRGYRDDCQYLNYPPMQQRHSKEVLIHQLKNIESDPRRKKTKLSKKARLQEESDSSVTILDVIDMDTSVEDLEETRQILLAKLNSENDSSDPVSADSGREEVSPPGENEPIEGNETIVNTPSTSKEDDKEMEAPSPKQSKLLAMGTPISIRHSSFNALPSREKFAQSMGDLELFENLPNSTGTYQKLRSLLQKVKNVFKK